MTQREQLPPCPDRLQQLMSHVALHEGAETEGDDPPGSAHHLKGPVPGVAQRSPHCWIPMVSATHTFTEMQYETGSMQTHLVRGLVWLGFMCLRFMRLGFICLYDCTRV